MFLSVKSFEFNWILLDEGMVDFYSIKFSLKLDSGFTFLSI